jgi:hypothetical protein
LEEINDLHGSTSPGADTAPNHSTSSLNDMRAAMLNFYPLFIVLAGFLVAALLSERAISQMHPDAKAALVDATARTRLLTIPVVALFLGLLLWRPIVGWIFLGVAYVCLAGRSIIRVQHLDLPVSIARRLQSAHLVFALGMFICAGIFALRAVG